MMSEILLIARSSSSVLKFYKKNNGPIIRVEKQGAHSSKLIKQIMKAYENDQLVFQKYDILNRDILRIFLWHSFLRYIKRVEVLKKGQAIGQWTLETYSCTVFSINKVNLMRQSGDRYWPLRLSTYYYIFFVFYLDLSFFPRFKIENNEKWRYIKKLQNWIYITADTTKWWTFSYFNLK